MCYVATTDRDAGDTADDPGNEFERDPDLILRELTKIVRKEGVDLEEKWLREHAPDDRRQKCRGCAGHVREGVCYFRRAALRARHIRTQIEKMRRERATCHADE